METNISLHNLLYIDEHLSCRHYMNKVNRGLKYLEMDKGTQTKYDNIESNYLLFITEGKIRICSGQHQARLLSEGEIVMLPRTSRIKLEAVTSCNFLSLCFSTPQSPCDKLVLESLSDLCNKIKYNLDTVKAKYPLDEYIKVITYLLKNGMNCIHLHDLIEKQIFFIFRGFYAKEELASLFYPIIAKDVDFKDFIINNYRDITEINELIELSNVSRSKFFIMFKDVFGMTAKQWLLKQKDEMIKEAINDPNVTVKYLIDKFSFASQSHITTYFKAHFGSTPGEMIKRYHSAI